MSTCISNPVLGSNCTRWSATPCPMGPEPGELAAAVGFTAPACRPAADARKPPRLASRSEKTLASRMSISMAASDNPSVSATPVKSGWGKKWLSPSILRTLVCCGVSTITAPP